MDFSQVVFYNSLMEALLEDLRLHIEIVSFCRIQRQWDDIPPHRPSYTRLYVCSEGRGTMRLDGKPIPLRPGWAYLLPAQSLVELLPSPGLAHHYIHFTSQALGGLSLFDLVDYRSAVRLADLSDTCAKVERLGRLVSLPGLAEEMETQALLRLLLVPFLVGPRGGSQVSAYQRFRPALAYVEEHLSETIPVSTLAGLTHLHPNYFSNLFVQTIGRSPRQYILRKRIERAQNLLRHTELPLKGVAAACGWDDACYFSRVFRRRVGLTPGVYRRRRHLWRS